MIPLHPFGRTGHESTRIIFGAAALGAVTQDEADSTLELIRSHGINHIDTAAFYFTPVRSANGPATVTLVSRRC